ncbi:MAG: PA14 domain-containing protein [Phycisphaerae bacterium]
MYPTIRSRSRLILAALAGLQTVAVIAAPQASDLLAADHAVARLGLLRGDVRSLDLPPGNPEHFQAKLWIDGAPATLDLVRYSLRGDGFRVLVPGADGTLVEHTPPPVATYRGVVLERAESLVAASLSDGRLSAYVREVDGRVWGVQPLDAGSAADAAAHVVYAMDDVAVGEWTCGVETLGNRGDGSNEGGAGGTAGAGCNRLAQIAFDADYEFYQLNGSAVPNTVADIENVMNSVELIYVRDVQISYEITTIIVRTSIDDPYTSTNYSTLLNEFRDHWLAQQGAIVRDVAHFMTGKEIDGNVIGVAWLSAICTDLGYGLSQSRFTTALTSRVALTAHELGHNWAAPHCNADPDCSIMCSGLGGCTGNLTSFSSGSIAAMVPFRDSRGCLSAGPLLAPFAIDDLTNVERNTPRRIDVLANDTDPNCDVLTITTFSATSAAGGVVVRAIGTGPGGRDELLYTPPVNYVGADSFSYSVVDDDAQTDSAVVSINVYVLRTPDNPLGVLPGVRVEYYALTAPSALPNFATLAPYATEIVPQINYASTSDVFAGSGRADDVGAVYTGYVTVPQDGLYTLFTESDDGSRLLVGSQLVVNNDGLHGMQERSGVIGLQAGAHAIRVEFFERGGGAGLIVRYQGPATARQVIPTGAWTRRTESGDLNCDGVLNNFDIDAFVLALTNAAGYAAQYPACDRLLADVNGDSSVDNFDIDAFVARLAP